MFFHHHKRGRHHGQPGMHAMRGGFGHGFGRGFGGRGDREGGRGRRMFDGGELKLVLLKLIADEPRHGYDLIREIESLTGGAYAPSPGVVYPTLTLLDEMGLVAEQQAEGAKKRFAITETGTAHLAENEQLVTALMGRLAEVGAMRAKTDGGSIRRAMGNLRVAIQNRLMTEDADAALLHQVSAILDEAAQKIERLETEN